MAVFCYYPPFFLRLILCGATLTVSAYPSLPRLGLSIFCMQVFYFLLISTWLLDLSICLGVAWTCSDYFSFMYGTGYLYGIGYLWYRICMAYGIGYLRCILRAKQSSYQIICVVVAMFFLQCWVFCVIARLFTCNANASTYTCTVYCIHL